MVEQLNDMQKLDLAIEGVNRLKESGSKNLQESIESEYGVSISEDVSRTLGVLNMPLKVAEFGDNVNRLKPSGSIDSDEVDKDDNDAMRVYSIVNNARSNDGTVYMGVSLNQKKARIAWDLGRDDYTVEESDNLIVEIPHNSWYDRFENAFGWEKLQDISLRSIADYQGRISEKTYNELLEEMGVEDFDGDEKAMEEAQSRAGPTPPEEEKLNIRVGSKDYKQKKIFSKHIKEMFENDGAVTFENVKRTRSRFSSNKEKEYSVDKLILSPTSAERNISDNYHLCGPFKGYTIALANCNVRTFEYLEHLDSVYHIDEFFEGTWDVTVETSEGTKTLSEIRGYATIHVVSERVKEIMMDVLNHVPEAIEELFTGGASYFSGRSWDGPNYSDMVYVPVTKSEFFEMLPAAMTKDTHVIYGETEPRVLPNAAKQCIYSDGWVYAAARLRDWDTDSVEMDTILSKSFPDLAHGGYEIIGNMAERHDKGEPPISAV